MAQDRRVIRTKASLTRALFELLEEKDFSRITITELSRRAGVDRKTFYLHFQSLDDVLEAFYEEALSRVQEGLEREGLLDGRIDLTGFFQVLDGVIAEDAPLCRRLAAGSGYTYFIERLRKLLKTAVENALTQQGGRDETEIRFYSEFYAAGVMRAYLAWLRGDVELDEEELTRLMVRAVNQGIGGSQV